MIIKIESLIRIFEKNYNSSHCSYGGKCHNCGCNVEVEITKTAGGYGLQGGVIFETYPEHLVILCGECYKKSGKPYSAHPHLNSQPA
jgi:hypothetical protein